jgi:hypothetical protein
VAGAAPIAGAAVQLYGAGTTGNGSAATALLTSAIITDATGSFSVPAGYPCPTETSELYVVVRGGSVGNAAANASIALATAPGVCTAVKSGSQFVINEVTTVATAWGLAQFFSNGGNVGASSTNAQGLANAFATVANLANLTTGASPGAGFPSIGASPAAKINTLASVLNTCTTKATACGGLFSAATPAGGVAPGDTLAAALNVVQNPGDQVAAVYSQMNASSPFAPVLTTAPSDWTLFINYVGGGMSLPSGVGVDSVGNVWVASYSTLQTNATGAVSEFTVTGTPVFPNPITSGGLLNAYGLSIDSEDNVWIPDEESQGVNGNFGSVTVLNSSGQVISGATGYSSGGLTYPKAIGIDSNGTAWVVNYGDSSLTLLSSSGQPLSGATGYTSPEFGFPVAIAIDANHNAWVANSDADTVTKVSPDGSQITSYNCCDEPDGIAIDQRGYVWVANFFDSSISQLASDGTVVSSGYSDNGASIAHPQGIAIDGAGHVWVANFRGKSVTELAGSAAVSPGQILSPGAGYAADAGMETEYAIAIDASGNLWITNFNSNTLTEIVGLATPVKTPLIGPAQVP